jgi:nucleotide-binding universal stress UspA family protein
MFQHIMVPLDGSQQAEQALPIAARIARASKGSLLLVRVVTDTIEYGLYPDKNAIAQQEERLTIDHDAATYYLTGVTYKEELAGLDVKVEVLSGEPVERILSLVEREPIDLIIMCRHGVTDAGHWTLGRTVQKVARHCPVRVLLASTSDIVSVQLKEQRSVCALVGLDGSPVAEEALVPAANLVTALSMPAPGALCLVHVTTHKEREGKHGTQTSGRGEQIKYAGEAYVQEAADRLGSMLPDLKLSINTNVIAADDVARALVGFAEHGIEGAGTPDLGAIDMIALVTHGRSGMKRWMMGSIAERVLFSTKLPLLLVRPQHRKD